MKNYKFEKEKIYNNFSITQTRAFNCQIITRNLNKQQKLVNKQKIN